MPFHFVSNSPHHLDVIWLAGVQLHLFPDAADVDHHRVFAGVGGLLPPHPAIDLLRREYPARVGHQQLHDLGLRGSQPHRFPVRQKLAALRVVGEAAVDQLSLAGLGVDVSQLGVPPELAADPGRQLLGVEGLGDVVIRPHGQSQDLVGVLAFGRQHDHRQIPLLPDPHQSGQTVQLRHHHIQHDQVHRLRQCQIHGLQAVGCLQAPVALPLQCDGDGTGDLGVIVHHQNALVHVASLLEPDPVSHKNLTADRGKVLRFSYEKRGPEAPCW